MKKIPGKRGLTTIEEEQLVKRIFSFEITRDGVEMTSIIDKVMLDKWMDKRIDLKFIFKNRTDVSTGYERDSLLIKINPEAKVFFQAAGSDLVLSEDKEM